MADILRNLEINGVNYNVGYSQNDLTDELKAKYDAAESNAITASAVIMSESEGEGNILKVYTFSQNGKTIGTINTPRDLVVTGGEIVEKEGVKYLSLTIANQTAPVEIAVTDLVDVYKGSAYIDIAADNTVTVNVTELATAMAAEGNAVGDKLKANTEAAAAAQTTADNVRADLGNKTDTANADGSAFARIAQVKADLAALSGGEGSVSEQIDAKITAYDTATVQPVVTKVNGISEGANKVTMTVEGETLKITIA